MHVNFFNFTFAQCLRPIGRSRCTVYFNDVEMIPATITLELMKTARD